jgi:hypothetical protein
MLANFVFRQDYTMYMYVCSVPQLQVYLSWNWLIDCEHLPIVSNIMVHFTTTIHALFIFILILTGWSNVSSVYHRWRTLNLLKRVFTLVDFVGVASTALRRLMYDCLRLTPLCCLFVWPFWKNIWWRLTPSVVLYDIKYNLVTLVCLPY